MRRVWLFMAGLFLNVAVNAQLADSISMQVITLKDVAIVDFLDDNQVFKSKDLAVHSMANTSGENLGDLLLNTLPVYFKDYSAGGVKTIDFRGTGAERTKVYWNGMPVNSPTLGAFDFSLIPFYFVEDARIRFGGASLSDGGGGLGGSVQLVNPAEFKQNRIELTGSYGSFGSYSVAAKALMGLKKFKSDTRILFNGAKNNYPFVNEFKKDHPVEYRSHNEVGQIGFQQVFSYHVNKQNALSARLIYSEMDRNLPAPVSSVSVGDARQNDRLLLSQLAWDLIPGNHFFLKVRSGFQNQLNRFVQGDYIDATTLVNAWNNHVNFGYYGFNRLKLSSSLRFDRYWVNSDGVGKIKEDRFTGLIRADWQLFKAFELALGARFKTIVGSSSPVMPFGGLLWRIAQNAGVLKVNISQVYRFPTINDRFWVPGGNPDLNTENGWNYELGYHLKRNLGKFTNKLELTGFYSLINQWILWRPSAQNPLIWEAQNIWQVRNGGVEFSFYSDINLSENNNLGFGINYTYVNSSIAGTAGDDQNLIGKQLILSPAHQIFIPVEWKVKNWMSAIHYRFVSKRYSDLNNDDALNPYHLLDLVLGYRFLNQRLQAMARVENILNTTYQTVPGRPMPGINFNLTLTWKIY